MKNIIFVCLNYKPAHQYTIDSIAYLFKDECSFFMLKDFSNYESKFLPSNCKFCNLNNLDDNEDNIFYFVSPAKDNILLVRKIKKICRKAKLVYLYHEPILPLLTYVKDHGFSFKTFLVYFGLLFKNGYSLCKKFDLILLPSNYAKILFEKKRRFRKITHEVMELLFIEEDTKYNVERKYVSYIGTIAKNHGFNEFVDAILKMDNQKILIATSSIVPSKIKEQLIKKHGSNLLIDDNHFISNDDMNKYFCLTKALWLGYKNSTQSGVLPMALMHKTPILFANINSFKGILKDNYNGKLIDIYDIESILSSLNFVNENLEVLTQNSYKTYNDLFNPLSKKDKIIKLVTKLYEKQ